MPTSLLSRALADVRLQLKTRKTRGGRHLEPPELAALEQKRDHLVAKMRDQRQEKFLARIQGQVSEQADRVIEEVPRAVQQCIVEELDKRVGPPPATDLDEALAARARNNKRIRELRKEEAKKQAAPETSEQAPPSSSTEPPRPSAEPPRQSAEDAALERELVGDDFESLRESLAKFQVEGYDIWHVPAEDARQLFDLGELDAESLRASLAGIPTKRAKEEIAPGAPQFIAGDHVSHGGHFRPKGYDTLLTQTDPLEDGVWMNRYPGTAYKFHASTCHISSVPPIERAARGYNKFLTGVGLPPSNICMDRFYADCGKHLGWHSDEVKDLAQHGLIAVMRTGRRRFQVRDKESSRMIFDRVVEEFDWVIMTAHGSNLITEHCVPKEDGAIAAGSWSFRTSVARIVQKTLRKRLRDNMRNKPAEGDQPPKKRAR